MVLWIIILIVTPTSNEEVNTNTNTNNSINIVQKETESKKEKVVYKTPSGKRYYFDPNCGGPNSKQTDLESAKSLGLTPCKKCAQ